MIEVLEVEVADAKFAEFAEAALEALAVVDDLSIEDVFDKFLNGEW